MIHLAVAYAAGRDYNKVLGTAEKALELAEASGLNKLAEQVRTNLKSYKQALP